MWSVVIADDEPIIRNGIAKIIPWEKYGCQVAGTARNGEEALKLIRQTGARIVISDIKMPKMSGLELLDELKKAGREVFFIIVSGYDEFQYVQKALNNGAFGYLLKPIIPEELEGMLGRATKSAAGEKSQEGNRKGNPKTAAEKEPYSRLEWLPAWLAGDMPQDGKERLQSELAAEDKRWHRMILLHTPKPGVPEETSTEEMFSLAEKVLGEYFPQTEHICFVKNRYFVYAVLSTQEEQGKEAGAERLEQAWKLYGRFRNTAWAVSCAGYGLRALLDMQQQIQKLARFQLFGGERFLTEKQYKKERGEWEKAAGFSGKELEDLVLAGEKEKLLKKLHESVEGKLLPECRYILKSALFQGYETSVLPSQKSADYRPEWLALKKEKMERAEKSHELWKITEEAFHEVFGRLELLCAKNMQMVVERAKAIARLEYADGELSLGLVAQRLGFNTTYFSHIFSAVSQQGFAEYLTDVRIRKAKELLRTDIKIQNIAQSIGYSSQPYFSTRFRAETGLTPSQYRENAKN